MIECGVVECFLSSGVVARGALLSSNNDVRPCTSATANRGVHAGARLDHIATLACLKKCDAFTTVMLFRNAPSIRDT